MKKRRQASPACESINAEQLRAFMRIKPTMYDTAAFFQVSEDTVRRFIQKTFKTDFATFRDQNMVFTRHDLIRQALKEAHAGNTAMLIFCLKNLCGWKDKFEAEEAPFSKMSTSELVIYAKKITHELESQTSESDAKVLPE